MVNRYHKYTMIFHNNKYSRWYNQIIERAKCRLLTGEYKEIHHIIPKCLGGNNDSSNLVELTAREHFIAHWLLTKMVDGNNQKKMAYACKMMMHSHGKGQQRHRVTSRIYETLKQNLNIILKGREFTDEWKNKLKISAQNRAANESQRVKQSRRETMIKVNKARKGEKRLASTGSNNHFYGKGFFGEENHFYGKHHTEETLKKLRGPKTKHHCNNCNTLIGGKSNYDRWHGDNCKAVKGELKFHA